jgi:Putative lactococcus lactis phage r1t holin
MFTQYFWKATFERAVKSFAQSLLALLSAQQIGLLDVRWATTLSTAGMVTLLSVLTSLASSQVGNAQDPSALSSGPPSRPDQVHAAAA